MKRQLSNLGSNQDVKLLACILCQLKKTRFIPPQAAAGSRGDGGGGGGEEVRREAAATAAGARKGRSHGARSRAPGGMFISLNREVLFALKATPPKTEDDKRMFFFVDPFLRELGDSQFHFSKCSRSETCRVVRAWL